MSTLSPNPHGTIKTTLTHTKNQQQKKKALSKSNKTPGLFNWKTLLFLIGPGAGFGVATWWPLGWTIQTLDAFLTAITILAGFLFALLIFVFQLRLQVHYDPRVQQRNQVPTYIDQLFRLTLYATGYAVLLTAGIVAVESTLKPWEKVPMWISSPLTGLLVIFVSALFVICMKMNRAYKLAAEGREIRQ